MTAINKYDLIRSDEQPSLAFVESRLAGQNYCMNELEKELRAVTDAIPALRVADALYGLSAGDKHVPLIVQQAFEQGVIADYTKRINEAEKKAKRLIGEAHRFYTLLARPDYQNELEAIGNNGPPDRLEGSIAFERSVQARKLEGLTKEEFFTEWNYVTGALPHIIPETLLTQRIEETRFVKGDTTAELNRNTRLHLLCQRLHVQCILDLVTKEEVDILATKNSGQGTLHALKDYLSRHGLRLGMAFNAANWNTLY